MGQAYWFDLKPVHQAGLRVEATQGGMALALRPAMGAGLGLNAAASAAMALALVPALTGQAGQDSAAGQAQISADPDNQLTRGTDDKLFVPPPQQLASAQW